jgi:cytochrome b561
MLTFVFDYKHQLTAYIMRFIKNPNITIAILAIYTAIMYIYLFPKNTEMSNTEKWITVGISVGILVLLWFLLRRRNRLRKEREEKLQNNRNL